MSAPIEPRVGAICAIAWLCASAVGVAWPAEVLTGAQETSLADAPFASQRRLTSPTPLRPSVASASSRIERGAWLSQGLLRDWQYVGFARRGDWRVAWVERLGQSIQIQVGDRLGSEGASVVGIAPGRLQLRQSTGAGSQVEYLWPYLARKGQGD